MMKYSIPFLALALSACGDGSTEAPYRPPPGGTAGSAEGLPSGGEPAEPEPEATEPEAAEEAAEEGLAEGGDIDAVENWVVWPGEHAGWVRFEDGVTTITREAVDTVAKTLVCNKPGTPIDGDSAHIEGRWRHDISDGVGRVTVRYFVGDQPLKREGKRVYTDLSIGREASGDWIALDRWVDIPEGADNLRYCTELKGSDGVVTADDLRISEWK